MKPIAKMIQLATKLQQNRQRVESLLAEGADDTARVDATAKIESHRGDVAMTAESRRGLMLDYVRLQLHRGPKAPAIDLREAELQRLRAQHGRPDSVILMIPCHGRGHCCWLATAWHSILALIDQVHAQGQVGRHLLQVRGHEGVRLLVRQLAQHARAGAVRPEVVDEDASALQLRLAKRGCHLATQSWRHEVHQAATEIAPRIQFGYDQRVLWRLGPDRQIAAPFRRITHTEAAVGEARLAVQVQRVAHRDLRRKGAAYVQSKSIEGLWQHVVAATMHIRHGARIVQSPPKVIGSIEGNRGRRFFHLFPSGQLVAVALVDHAYAEEAKEQLLVQRGASSSASSAILHLLLHL